MNLKTNKYRLEHTSIGPKWDSFVNNSPNGTFFSKSKYLSPLQLNIHAYYCYKKEHISAAILCIVSLDSKSIVGDDLIIYDGLIFEDMSHLNAAQKRSEIFKIQTFVAEQLLLKYDKIKFSLHYSIKDIRPFIWVNYGKKLSTYIVKNRYTSIIDISEFHHHAQFDDLLVYKNSSVSRRQEIRYGKKKNVFTRKTDNIDNFLNFYKMTLVRQNINVSNEKLKKIEGLIRSLLVEKKLIMLESLDENMNVGSMAIFLLDNEFAFYLFGANNPEMRNQHTGTAVLWDSFFILNEIGIKKIDLEGVNSPNRGWFKLSFGGSLENYFEVNKVNFK